MIDGRNGITYATATEFRDEWPDVTPGLLRTWASTGRITVVTYGELAEALDYPLPDDTDPADEARASGRHGAENVYRYREVSKAETATRLHRRKHGGRPRRDTPPRAVHAFA
jgi:hypothetical protein